MTTTLPINQQVNLNSLALEAQDLDLTGNLTVAGSFGTYKSNIINNTASAGTTLTASQSGSSIVMTNLAGNTFTLPAAAVGLTYTFIVGLVNTSVAYKVITPASVFIAGSLPICVTNTAVVTGYQAVATTTRSVNLNGTTTGGATIGDFFTLTCVSSTLWVVTDGFLSDSSGATAATPFANS